jgi:putative ABC transport system substrate-binding protein
VIHRRLTLVVTLAFALLTATLPVAAQKAATPVIGLLSSTSLSISKAFVAAFRQGLSESGYVEGQNLTIEYRWADGQFDRLPGLATDLVNRRVAAIAAFGPPAALAAKSVTSTIPLIFIAGEAIPLGLVASLNRPGGNATGVSILTASLWAKRLELLSELVPKATTFAILLNPQSQDEPERSEMQTAARTLGRRLVFATATREADINAAFVAALRQGAGALLVSPDPFFTSRRVRIVELATRHALPTMYGWREYVVAGGLMSYGASLTDAWRQVGIYTARILKGDKPADLPVQQPTKFELVVNVKTAKALGLTIPPSVLLRADQIIE